MYFESQFLKKTILCLVMVLGSPSAFALGKPSHKCSACYTAVAPPGWGINDVCKSASADSLAAAKKTAIDRCITDVDLNILPEYLNLNKLNKNECKSRVSCN